MTAKMSFALLQGLGVPAFRQGHYISIPSGRFEIAEYCAGLRYLMAAISMGVFFAWQHLSGFRQQLKFVLLVVVVAIVANWLRVVVVMVAGHLSEMQSPLVADHATMGWLMFAGFMFPVFWFGGRWPDKQTQTPGTVIHHAAVLVGNGKEQKAAQIPWLLMLLMPLALLLGPLLVSQYSRTTERAPDPVVWSLLPDRLGVWQKASAKPQWQPEFHGASHEWLARYDHADKELNLLVVYYTGQQQGSEIVYALNSPYNRKRWRLVSSQHRLIPFSEGDGRSVYEVTLQAGYRNRLITYWYDVDGQVVDSRVQTKLLELKRLLQGETGTALLAVAIDFTDRAVARQQIDTFLGMAYPQLRQWLNAIDGR